MPDSDNDILSSADNFLQHKNEIAQDEFLATESIEDENNFLDNNYIDKQSVPVKRQQGETKSQIIKDDLNQKDQQQINNLNISEFGIKGVEPKITSQEKEEALINKIKEIKLSHLEKEANLRATQQGLEYINLAGLPIVPEALKIIDEKDAREKQIICFLYRPNREMRLAVVQNNQLVRNFIDELASNYPGINIRVFLTSKDSFDKAVKKYASLPKIIDNPDEVKILEADLKKNINRLDDLHKIETEINQASTTEIFSIILAAAIKLNASDIHIEAEEKYIKLRFRIDGVLHEIAKLDKQVWQRLLARIKLSAKLKINVVDKPQDGNFSVNLAGERVDFRISSLPTAYGESIVIRALYHNKVKRMTLDNLGIDGYNRKIIDQEIQKPNGMMIITGPTGSGKTTTLYAILNKLNTTDNKIITVEDPIEYKITGINQSEIKKDKGYTFAKALRSIVRQDPDVILIGEIRDSETAEIALNAALTGHLVFSTLHTNKATGVISRFLSLGAKTYLLAPAINVSLAQRLVRRVCQHCKYEVSLTSEQKEIVKKDLEALPDAYDKDKLNLNINELKFYEGRGCQHCAGLGYKGQIGIFEVFVVTDEVRELILNNQISEFHLNDLARRYGMVTMRQDGIIKASQGITSLSEVFRVV